MDPSSNYWIPNALTTSGYSFTCVGGDASINVDHESWWLLFQSDDSTKTSLKLTISHEIEKHHPPNLVTLSNRFEISSNPARWAPPVVSRVITPLTNKKGHLKGLNPPGSLTPDLDPTHTPWHSKGRPWVSLEARTSQCPPALPPRRFVGPHRKGRKHNTWRGLGGIVGVDWKPEIPKKQNMHPNKTKMGAHPGRGDSFWKRILLNFWSYVYVEIGWSVWYGMDAWKNEEKETWILFDGILHMQANLFTHLQSYPKSTRWAPKSGISRVATPLVKGYCITYNPSYRFIRAFTGTPYPPFTTGRGPSCRANKIPHKKHAIFISPISKNHVSSMIMYHPCNHAGLVGFFDHKSGLHGPRC